MQSRASFVLKLDHVTTEKRRNFGRSPAEADRTEDLRSFLKFFRVVPYGQLFCTFSAESENAEGNQRSLVASVATRLDL